MMEFMRPLALWKKRDKTTTQQNHESVSRSLSHSLSQPASQPSPPEHCNHLHKQHPQSSIISEPIMHPDGWCTYLRFVFGERGRSHRHRRAARRIYRSTTLHERINSKSSTNPNESHQRQTKHSQGALVRPAASGRVKEKVVLHTTRHQNLPHSDVRKVSNRIDDAIRTKPRSEEGERRCAMK